MKRLIIGLVVLIVVLVGGFIAAVVTLNAIDWSKYQEPIAAAVRDATGRELRFGGSLNINIGLSPGISANGVRLQNAPWASRADMLTVDNVEVHLKLLPLIFGQVEVSRIELIGLDLLLETDAQGQGNWILELTDEPAPDVDDDGPGDGQMLTAAVLGKAVIRNATIVYLDGTTGESQRVTIDEFVARMESVDAPLKMDLAAAFGDEPIELEGELTGVSGLPSGGALGLDLALRALGASVTMAGRVERPLYTDGIDISIDAEGVSLTQLTAFAGAPVADLGAYRLGARITGNADAIRLSDLVVDLKAADATIGVTGSVQDAVALEGIDVALRIDGRSLAALSTLAGTQLPDLGAYQVAANVAGTADKIKVSNLRIGIADMQIDGNVAADIAARPMRLEATLRAPRIDLTRLLPAAAPAPEETAPPAGGTKERLFPDDPLPLDGLDALGALDADVRLEIGALVVDAETTLTNLDVGLDVGPGTVRVKPLKLTAMGAAIDGRVGLDVIASGAKVAAALAIRHPSIGDLVEEGGDTMLTGGPLDMTVDVTGTGRSVRDIMASLNGTLAVELGTTRINNKWVQRAFADAMTIVKKRGEAEPVDLHCVTTDINIKDGIAIPKSLVIDTRGVSLFGKGQINLRDETLKLDFDRLAASLSASSALPPFQVRGTLASPTGRIDAKALAGKTLGFGAALLTKSDTGITDVAAATGPERCRQRLVVYEQVQTDRTQSKQKTIEAAGDAAGVTKEVTQEVMDKLGGFLRRKKRDDGNQE